MDKNHLARPKSSVFNVLALYLLVAALSYIVRRGMAASLGAELASDGLWLWIARGLAAQLAIALPVFVYARRGDVGELVMLRPMPVLHWFRCGVYGLICMFVCAVLNCAWDSILRFIPCWTYAHYVPATSKWWQAALLLGCGALAPAWSGGLISGALLSGIERHALHPALLVGALYALLQADIGRFPEYLLLGSSAAYMALRYGSVHGFIAFTASHLLARMLWDELAILGVLPISSWLDSLVINDIVCGLSLAQSSLLIGGAALLITIYALLMWLARTPSEESMRRCRSAMPDDVPTLILMYAACITGVCALATDILKI